MDQRIFNQLDLLERGARFETRPARDEYHDSSADYSAYEGNDAHYGQADRMQPSCAQTHDEFMDQPMILDSFGESHVLS